MSSVRKMPSNKRKSSTNSVGARRRIRIWMGFMIIFLGWAAYTYIAQSGEIEAKSQLLVEKQASQGASQDAMEQLEYEINRLQDPEYIGQIAMKKYGLFKPGEIPVRVLESSSSND